jgi:hypothetical protein
MLFVPASFGQWQPVITDLSVTAVQAYGDSLFIGTNDGQVRWSTDLGATWTDISGNLPDQYVAAIVRGEDGRLLCTDGDHVHYTDNWGTWLLGHDLGASAHCMVSSDSLIIAGSGSNGGLFASLDNGTTWANIASGVANQYFTSVAYDGTSIYAGRFGAVAIASSDLGGTWTAIDGLSGENIFALHYFNGLFAGGYSSIYSPGDLTWSINSIDHQTLDFATSGSLIAACGTDDAVYLSFDHGITWPGISTNYTDFQINQIAFVDDILFAGNSDGLYKLDIDTWAGVEELSASRLITLYPDPATDRVSIDLPEGAPRPSGLMVTDANGRVVLRAHPDRTGPASTLDVSGLASGSYQVLVQFPNATVHRPLVIAH